MLGSRLLIFLLLRILSASKMRWDSKELAQLDAALVSSLAARVRPQ